jgi:Protein of unknown function (DUF1569)
MKNLLNESVKNEIEARIDTLNENAVPAWGKMNVNQMMRHLSMALEMPIGEFKPTAPEKDPMPKWLMKIIMMNVKVPKNIDTFKEMNVIEHGIQTGTFAEEKRQLKQSLEKFYNAKKFVPEHALAGKFTPENWGKLSYNHLDHHLGQFGV